MRTGWRGLALDCRGGVVDRGRLAPDTGERLLGGVDMVGGALVGEGVRHSCVVGVLVGV